jgi:predicted MFS family arabinose efflux permease
LALPVLAVLVALAGAARGFGDNARAVLLPGTAEQANVSLERASGLYDGGNRLAAVVGAPTAGVLVAVSSPAAAIAVDALTFVASAILVATLVPRTAEPEASTRAEDGGYWRSLGEGLTHLRGDRLLLGIVAMVAVTNLVDQAGSAVLVPVWAHDVVHSALALGLVGGVFSCGAVAGNALTTWLGHRLPRRLTYAVGFAIAGAPRYVALALARTLSPVLAVMAIGGLGAGGINPILGAVEYERVPRQLQARVLGAVQASAWVGIPFGSLIGGLAVTSLGLRTALLGAGAMYGLTTLAPFVFPVWRGMDRRLDGQLVSPSEQTTSL